ncbi:hypothetical protein FKZ61_022570 [Litorilinea aerophila]|uniref:Uncharacterized protein n=1 Tax=Litorilinea aerophila TaxID=1204385 RepID=A0A540V8S5_9CHLR|nr:hypothetical protein [Litorilinea aerophila]MCC9078883.1 hypothetical protein [Litorilinea aerophila]GIV77387.1 MAG: hypothetical protein KatS3mg050_1781 [Litorilinea sp.]
MFTAILLTFGAISCLTSIVVIAAVIRSGQLNQQDDVAAVELENRLSELRTVPRIRQDSTQLSWGEVQ